MARDCPASFDEWGVSEEARFVDVPVTLVPSFRVVIECGFDEMAPECSDLFVKEADE